MDARIFERGTAILLYAFVSTIVALAVLSQCTYNYSNFYTAGLALSKNGSFIVFGNLMFLISLILGKLVQMIIFGELRLLEIEHVYERSWFTVINSLMAIAMFRHENYLLIMVLVLGLLFMKVFHWILADRLDFIIQSSDDLKTAILNRCTFALMFFLYIDYKIVVSCIDQSFIHSGDLFVMFGSDFAMIFLNLVESTANFVLNLIELKYLQMNPEEDNWEFKVWLSKPIAIVISVIRVAAIICEFFGLINAYKLPINFPGDIYMASTKLLKQIKEFHYLIKSIKELERNLTDATKEDLDRDEVCIICRYDMEIDEQLPKNHRSSPKKLSCGHVLHYGCLKSWLSRSKNCPTCRADVFQTNTSNFARNRNNENIANQENLNVQPQIVAQFPAQTHVREQEPAHVPNSPIADAHVHGEQEVRQRTPVEIQNIHYPTSVLHVTRPPILPPDWTLLPLKRLDHVSNTTVNGVKLSNGRYYKIQFNGNEEGNLDIVANDRSSNLQLHQGQIERERAV